MPVQSVDGEAAALVSRHRVFAFLRAEVLLSEERTHLLLSWRHSGLCVRTSVAVPPDDRKGLERLARYLLRPPVSLEYPRVDEAPQAIAGAARLLGTTLPLSFPRFPSLRESLFTHRPVTRPTNGLTMAWQRVSWPKVRSAIPFRVCGRRSGSRGRTYHSRTEPASSSLARVRAGEWKVVQHQTKIAEICSAVHLAASDQWS